MATPEEIVERMRALAEVGVTHVSMLMEFGGLNHALVMRSVRLIGEHVVPALRQVGVAH